MITYLLHDVELYGYFVKFFTSWSHVDLGYWPARSTMLKVLVVIFLEIFGQSKNFNNCLNGFNVFRPVIKR